MSVVPSKDPMRELAMRQRETCTHESRHDGKHWKCIRCRAHLCFPDDGCGLPVHA